MSVALHPVRSYAEVARSAPSLQPALPPAEPVAPPQPPLAVHPDAMRPRAPLRPETICKILCKYLAKGKTPEQTAHLLIQDHAFIFSVLEIPLKKLQAAAKDFPDSELPESIRQLYLFALSTTELITTIRTYENNFHGERDRLFKISDPGHWSLIVGAHCKSWNRVAELFRETISRPLKKDRELLIENIKNFRSWMTDLKELERALSMDKDNLFFLSQNCYCDSGYGYRMFPKCRRDFPPLFRQLERCQTQFPCQEILVALGRRSRQCQQLLDSIHPPKAEETELDRFYFTNDRVIYQAALELLAQLAKRAETEEFLYGYCDEHFGMDLNEWMHLIIAALPAKDLLPLSKSIYAIDQRKRGQFLCDYLNQELKLPKDLTSFKKRFEFQQGDIS